MIPVKVRMINFLSYADETFDFSKIKDATVIGRNGAGKSSFCTDSITWALFGQGEKGGVNESANYIRRGADSCTVEFTFEMNGNLYKVVRNKSLVSKKSGLVLFGITDGGEEVPLADRPRETQEKINDMLKMSYETFTASSIVLQGQIHAFTEGMKDTDKKAALLNILNVGIWDFYNERNKKELKDIKSEMDVCTGKLETAKEAVEKESELKARIQQAEATLASCQAEKKKQHEILDSFTARMAEMNAAENAIEATKSLIASKRDAARSHQSHAASMQNDILSAQNSMASVNASITRSEKILAHDKEIRVAVVEEANLEASIEKMESARMKFVEANAELSSLKEKGIAWNKMHEQKMNTLAASITEKGKQAALLASVPCARTAYESNCPLLSMARQAKEDVGRLTAELEQEKTQVNPYRSQWAACSEKKKQFEHSFSENEIANAKTRKTDVHRYAVLLPQLESASAQIEESRVMLANLEETVKTKTAQKVQTESEAQKAADECAALEQKLTGQMAELSKFSALKAEYADAENRFHAAERSEREAADALASAKTVLASVADEKKKIEELEAKMKELEKRKEIADIFAEACNKKNGVPAFMVVNAIPELEESTNRVLEKMLDGRLQVKFRTTKDGSEEVGDFLKLDVQEQSEMEPREFTTFSGAEKFIVALALRIAMSRFLAHRAGSSVQLFVLDEGVSCADAENRDEIMAAIRGIKDEFAKILFITHDEELKDTLTNKIIVTRDSTGSHLRVE